MQYSEKITSVVDAEIEEIFRECFPKWITSLWYWVAYYTERFGFTFEENKEAFFYLLERLLREGKAKFIAPGADCYISPINPHPRFTIDDEEAHWHAPIEEIIAYLRSKWPQHATETGDLDLTYYFYEIPGIIWRGEDGKWHGS